MYICVCMCVCVCVFIVYIHIYSNLATLMMCVSSFIVLAYRRSFGTSHISFPAFIEFGKHSSMAEE